MTNTTAINAIRRFIYDAVRRAYNLSAGCPIEPQTDILKTPVLSSRRAPLQIELPSNFNEEINCLRQRLPQTRFFLTQFTSPSLTVDWLEFFGRTLIILQNHSEQPINLYLKDPSKPGLKIFPATDLTGGKVTLLSEMVLWDFDCEVRELPATLQSIRDNEYGNHPLNMVSCSSPPLMKKIDDAWAGLTYLDDNFQIKKEINSNEFLWLQEMLLFLGRYETLVNYYQKIKPHKQDALLTLAGSRFKRVVLGKGVSLPSDFKATEYDFLNNWLFHDFSEEGELAEKLQEAWERFSWPLLRMKFFREIQTNPHKWLAVYFLAQQRYFIWCDELREILKAALSGQTALLNIFNALDLSRRMVRLELRGASVSFSAGQKIAQLQQIKHTGSGFAFKQIWHKTGVSCYLQKEGQFDFKTDRLLSLEYYVERRLLQLRPVFVKPPLSGLSYREITVEAGGYRVTIPLVWQQFYIVFNGLRIRFLQKKKRFQLSLKLPASLPPVKINNEPLPTDKGRYLKTYINIGRQTGKFNVQLCDSAGRRLDGLISRGGNVFVSGAALDSFGLLHEKFRLLRNDKPGSVEVAGNRLPMQPVSLSQKDKTLKVTARRCNPSQIELQHGISVLQRLWLTPPFQLSLILTVFVEEEVAAVRQRFFEAWGFFPRVQIWEQSHRIYTHGDIIISQKQPPVLLAETFFGGIVRLKTNSEPQLLWVKTKQLDEFLSEGFRLLPNSD